ncbi:MAG: CU044_5270 family protein [Propionibacteriaceae bacterium]|nr:CU044_5270 family protein [Micropruina sp.]HBX80850.1 hypothetical protein [Propionibacteriaceae bacterium]HBY22717.1 hypothetical protein [Propionibacteriaceae bacterium]
MSDLIERSRPEPEGLDAEWTPEVQTDILREVTGPDRRPRYDLHPVRRRALVAVAAVAGLMLVAVPVMVPGWFQSTAAAVPLNSLADKTSLTTAPMWAEGQFLHVQTVSRQDDSGPDSEMPIHESLVRDDWITPDGWRWSQRVIDSSNMPGATERFIFPPLDGWMRPGYAATMPTEPHALDAFLRARALGSSSQDEAVFVAIGDMLKAEAAPPAQRSAAIRALALNPKVTVANGVDPTGRATLVVTFVDENTRPGVRQVLFLDGATGDLMGEARYHASGSYVATVTVREVVDALPDAIAKELGTEKVVNVGNTEPVSYPGPVDPTPVPSQTYTPKPISDETRNPTPSPESTTR